MNCRRDHEQDRDEAEARANGMACNGDAAFQTIAESAMLQLCDRSCLQQPMRACCLALAVGAGHMWPQALEEERLEQATNPCRHLTAGAMASGC